MEATKVIKMIRDGESLAFDYLSNKRCGILPMAGTLDRLQEIVTCLEGMDMQDIIAELSRLNQRQVRNLVLPLMYRHNGEDYDMPFDDVEALICKLDHIHDKLIYDITDVCGFSDFDDLFPVADKYKVRDESDPYSQNKTLPSGLYDWCRLQGLIDSAAYSASDFSLMIRKADFSILWSAKKSHAKVFSLISVLYKTGFFADRDRWLDTALNSISFSMPILTAKKKPTSKISEVTRNSNAVFTSEIRKILGYQGK